MPEQKKKKQDLITLTIPSNPKYVAVVRLVVSGIANRMNFDYQDIEDLKLALGEACNNAIDYAYKGKKSEGEIIIRCFNLKTKIVIEVEDAGKGFDYKGYEKKNKHISKKVEISEGKLGCGIYLMKSLMDKVGFSSNKPRGTIVHLTKILR